MIPVAYFQSSGTWQVSHLIFLRGGAFSDPAYISSPFGNIILLLFKLIYEVLLFSLANASCFALFLHRVLNRFFTALSVLTNRYSLYQLLVFYAKKYTQQVETRKNLDFHVITCLKPPLQSQSIYFQISFAPASHFDD